MTTSTRMFTMILLIGLATFLPRIAHANVDSFFDIFYEVSFDEPSGSPVVTTRGVIREPGFQNRAVQTEILSMSLTSYSSGRTSRHVVTLEFAASNIGSSGQDGVRGYAELEVVCRGNRNGTRCDVRSAKPISEADHRGHVTILK